MDRMRKKYGCHCTGNARENRIGCPHLKASKELARSPRGTLDSCSAGGFLPLRWKDNKIIIMINNIMGI